VSHVITVGEDITEWHAAQRRFAQAEKLAAIGQLAAGVMHEINNPLATIGACAESLELALGDLRDQGVNLPSSCGEYVRIVESEVQRCKRIVERLLQYSRPVPADAEPVDLNAVVEQTLFLLKHHARFKQFVVETDFAPGASPVVRGSTEQLVQVLMALLINAMDAMPEPGTIHVRTRMPARRDTAVIEVQDEGHGIPRTELTKIFEPFYTTKAPGRGTGLGLSICYGIVTEHGGTIEVESHQGAGSTFRVCIPVARAA
jgi:two-component system NtrC family sensor kinase